MKGNVSGTDNLIMSRGGMSIVDQDSRAFSGEASQPFSSGTGFKRVTQNNIIDDIGMINGQILNKEDAEFEKFFEQERIKN